MPYIDEGPFISEFSHMAYKSIWHSKRKVKTTSTQMECNNCLMVYNKTVLQEL